MVLVLDESTAMLDPKGRKEVLGVAEKLNKEQKTTVIAITHYMEEVAFADRVIVMNKGRVVLEGTPKEIFDRKDEIKAYGLELPLASEIADRLIKRGVKLPEGIITEEQLRGALCELKQKI
jgi:energy-coupling factor transport system ATP-binding protein